MANPSTCWTKFIGVIALTAAAACASAGGEAWTEVMPSPPEAGQLLRMTGTVRRVELEGGVWVVRDSAGTTFNPTNLPAAFQREGLAVEVEARRRDDMASIGMVGPIVEIIRIRSR